MSCWWSAIDGQEAEGFDAICSGEPSGTTGGFQPRMPQEFGDQEQIGAAAHERGGEQDQELAHLRDVGVSCLCRQRCRREHRCVVVEDGDQVHGEGCGYSRKWIRKPASAREASSRKSSC
jgi:hypothetical protein